MLLNHANQNKFNQISNELITWYGGLQALQSKPSDRDFCCLYVHENLMESVNKLTGLTAIYQNIGYWYPSSILMKPEYTILDEIIIEASAFKNEQAVKDFIEHILSNENNIDTSWLVPTEHLPFIEKEFNRYGLLFEVVDLGQTNEQDSAN